MHVHVGEEELETRKGDLQAEYTEEISVLRSKLVSLPSCARVLCMQKSDSVKTKPFLTMHDHKNC